MRSEFSSPCLQEEGVPQGSVLSVTLFAVAINGLMERIPAGVQGSLWMILQCTVVGPMPLKLAEKSRLPLMLLQIGPSPNDLGFLLRKLRLLGLLVPERGKRSQSSS